MIELLVPLLASLAVAFGTIRYNGSASWRMILNYIQRFQEEETIKEFGIIIYHLMEIDCHLVILSEETITKP